MADVVYFGDGVKLPCCPSDYPNVLDLNGPFLQRSTDTKPYASIQEASDAQTGGPILIWYNWCLYLSYPVNVNNTNRAYIQLGCD